MAIRDGIMNNRLSVKGFIALFVTLEIVLLLLYARYGASFSVTGDSVWKLVIFVHVFAGGGLLLLLRSERNWLSIFTGAALPILLYESFSWWRYSSSTRDIILAGIGTCVIIVPILAAAKVINVECVSSVKRRLFAAKTVRYTGVLLCVFLIAACLNGQILLRSQVEVYSLDYGGAYQEEGNENTLAANMPTIAKLDPDGGWYDLSTDEKTEVLATCLKVDCYYLGMHDVPSMKVAYMEEEKLGQYTYQDDTITVSYTYLVDSHADGYSVLHVLLHELHHRYAIRQVELLKKLKEDSSMAEYADLKLLDDAKAYEREMQSYVYPEDGSLNSFWDYSLQRIELDANKYADDGVADYYRKIDTYLRGD